MSFMRRQPLIAFFVLAYMIAWGFVPFGMFGAFAPLIAAFIVIPLTQGLSGLRERLWLNIRLERPLHHLADLLTFLSAQALTPYPNLLR